MITLQQCLLRFKCSAPLSSRRSAELKTWLSGKEYARLHSDISYKRFRVSKDIVAAHEIFKHSNNYGDKGATLPSKERLDEVEKSLGCVSCSPSHSLSAPFHSCDELLYLSLEHGSLSCWTFPQESIPL